MAATVIPYQERMKWFHNARFGMFIHWGLYSVLGRGEWVMLKERIPVAEYAKLANRFKPRQFDADTWANLAVEAGCKYVVFTTRHHDGFCLYDSNVSDFTSTKTAAKRDFVADYVKACRKAGLKVGLYYSLLDWRFPGYFDHIRYTDSAQSMIQQAHNQVRELMTNYGRIDYLFYDGEWIPKLPFYRTLADGKATTPQVAEFWHSQKLNSMVRRLQPHILINNRSGIREDIDTPEQNLAPSGKGRGWESCMTLGDFCGWGYIKNNPNWKTVPTLLQNLVIAASGEGNYLINIGPKPDGSVRSEEVKRMTAVGKWMKTNSEAIYGSERCGLVVDPSQFNMLGEWTRKGNTAYLHIFRWPGKEAVIPLIKTKAKNAIILETGQQIKVRQEHTGRLVIYGLPATPPNPYVTVIKIRFAERPRVLTETNPTAWLTAGDESA